MKHKLNKYASDLVDTLEDMDQRDEFRELQEMYDTFEDSMALHCAKTYPGCDVTTWNYDEDYDDWEEKIQDILDYICGRTVLDCNMITLRDVLMITIVTKKDM